MFLIGHGISVRTDLPVPEWLFWWATTGFRRRLVATSLDTVRDRLHAIGLDYQQSWATGNKLRDMQGPPKMARPEAGASRPEAGASRPEHAAPATASAPAATPAAAAKPAGGDT